MPYNDVSGILTSLVINKSSILTSLLINRAQGQDLQQKCYFICGIQWCICICGLWSLLNKSPWRENKRKKNEEAKDGTA